MKFVAIAALATLCIAYCGASIETEIQEYNIKIRELYGKLYEECPSYLKSAREIIGDNHSASLEVQKTLYNKLLRAFIECKKNGPKTTPTTTKSTTTPTTTTMTTTTKSTTTTAPPTTASIETEIREYNIKIRELYGKLYEECPSYLKSAREIIGDNHSASLEVQKILYNRLLRAFNECKKDGPKTTPTTTKSTTTPTTTTMTTTTMSTTTTAPPTTTTAPVTTTTTPQATTTAPITDTRFEPTTTAMPVTSTAEPTTTTIIPTTTKFEATTILAEPSTTANAPTTTANELTTTADAPTTTTDAPTTTTSEPSTTTAEPSTTTDSPTTTTAEPSTTTAEPSTTTAEPSPTINAPTTTTDAPTTTTDAPTTTTAEPSPTTNAPTTTTAASTTTTAKTTTTATTTTPATTIKYTTPTECLKNVNTITDAWRRDYNGSDVRPGGKYSLKGYACDQHKAQQKWFRFSGAAGNRILDKCPKKFSCGTTFPFWTDEQMPSVIGVETDIGVYGVAAGCKSFKQRLLVIRCSPAPHDFIYKQTRNYTTPCRAAFCSML